MSDLANSSGLKALGVILTILAVITGMAAIVRPMQQQMDYMKARIDSIETRILSNKYPTREELIILKELIQVRLDHNGSRIGKMEDHILNAVLEVK